MLYYSLYLVHCSTEDPHIREHEEYFGKPRLHRGEERLSRSQGERSSKQCMKTIEQAFMVSIHAVYITSLDMLILSFAIRIL